MLGIRHGPVGIRFLWF